MKYTKCPSTSMFVHQHQYKHTWLFVWSSSIFIKSGLFFILLLYFLRWNVSLALFLFSRTPVERKSHFTCINTQWIIYKSQLFGMLYEKGVCGGPYITHYPRLTQRGDEGKQKVRSDIQDADFFSSPHSYTFT